MTLTSRSVARASTLVLVTAAMLGPTAATAATAAATHQYSSCSAVHQHYSGGIAKAGVTSNTVHHRNGSVSHEPLRGHVKFSTSLYRANSNLDRDSDGIACEQS